VHGISVLFERIGECDINRKGVLKIQARLDRWLVFTNLVRLYRSSWGATLQGEQFLILFAPYNFSKVI
jgi:hypothetical protein